MSSHFDTDYARQHLENALSQVVDVLRYEVIAGAARVESPLEAAFFAWWYLCSESYGEAAIVPQADIVVGNHAYRADFLAGIPVDFRLERTPDQCVVVELDWHGFHERTREQVVARDRRDREVRAAGWTILHFSWSEFTADPLAALDTVQKAVRNLRRRVVR